MEKVTDSEVRIKALQIAAGVFAQIHKYNDLTIEHPIIIRSLKDFRESVNTVFKAVGIEKVEWDD